MSPSWQIAWLVPFAFAAVAALYYLLLAIVASFPSRDPAAHSGALDFAIVIPAHNEEVSLPATLAACRRLIGNPHLYVIADNCTDRTVDVADGATVLERTDIHRRGKGHALAWALPQVLATHPDAVVILDADCRPDPELLVEFNRRFAVETRVLQAAVTVDNPDANAATCLAALGNRLENDLFYAPKDRLGLSVFLRGTGMAFRRALLEQHPWEATSATEDHEYTLRLLRHGERIGFVADASVRTGAAQRTCEVRVQRRRWAGSLRGSIGIATSLFVDGIRLRRPTLIDAALTQLVLSKPLVYAQLALTTVIATAISGWMGLTACAVLAAVHASCLTLGMVRLGMTRHRLALLLSAIPAAGELVFASIRGVIGLDRAWIRTPRMGAAP